MSSRPARCNKTTIAELAVQNGYDVSGGEFLQRLADDWGDFKFKRGVKFLFRPPRTVVFGPMEPNYRLLALHELSHALLGHQDYRIDVERLKMEREAWEKARELALLYGVRFDEDLVQTELDTYRDWLHQKSRCPVCGLTRFQTPDSQYHCPSCETFKATQKTR